MPPRRRCSLRRQRSRRVRETISPGRGTALYAVIVLAGLAMGIRNATVRKLGVADLTTTVLTLGTAGLAADSSPAGGTNPGRTRRSASVVTMFAGAALGAWLLRTSAAWALGTAAAVSAGCALAAWPRGAGASPPL